MRAVNISPTSFDTLLLCRAAHILAHLATASGTVMVTFFMATSIVLHEIRVNEIGRVYLVERWRGA
jgi:hypothetical protein